MKKLIIIAAIVALAYWYKNRKVETAATEAAEPSLKSAWLLSSTRVTTPTVSGSTPSSTSDSSSSTSDSSSSTSDSSDAIGVGSGGFIPAAAFGSLEKPKSCFR